MDAQSPTTILVVEDEPALVETLEYTLRHQGYQVVTAQDGFQAIEQARTVHPDLILLDVMLPGLDGFEVCRLLRQETPVPILMLTARDEQVDKIVGLELGADDYITKPFHMRELLARIKAHLRRVRALQAASVGRTPSATEAPEIPPPMVFDDLTIDPARREVRRGGSLLHLKPKEYELLEFLARNRGIVLGRDLILERVWGWDYSGGSRTVDVHVRWLREKIEPDPAHPRRIVTVRGVGYRFEG